MSNIILEQINQVLGNIVGSFDINKTYVDKYDQWLVILMATTFAMNSTENSLKYYITGQLVLGHDIILLIKYTVDK